MDVNNDLELKVLNEVYRFVSYGCLDLQLPKTSAAARKRFDEIIDAVADGKLDMLNSVPSIGEVKRRGVLCVSYLQIAFEKRYGEKKRGTLDPVRTRKELKSMVVNFHKIYKYANDVPFLWFGQVLGLRRENSEGENSELRGNAWELLGLLPYMLYPTFLLESPHDVELSKPLERLWPTVELTLAGLNERVYAKNCDIYYGMAERFATENEKLGRPC